MDDQLRRLGLSPRRAASATSGADSGRIFERLDDDTSRRRMEADYRDLERDEVQRQEMLRKQAALKKARKKFEETAQSDANPAEMVSWRRRVEADTRVINGFNAANVEPAEPTVPERDAFLDRMSSDIDERITTGRGIHTVTEQAPTVDASAMIVAGTLRWRRQALPTSPRSGPCGARSG